MSDDTPRNGIDGSFGSESTFSSSRSKPQADQGRIRSVPGFVWIVTAAMFTILLLGSLILPQLLIPDEKHHADMALMVREGTWLETGWPGIGERRLDPRIVSASLSLGPVEESLRENRAAQHPPLSYVGAALTSWLVTIPIEDPNLALQIWSFRFFSVLASAALPVVFYLIAAELSDNRWIRLSSALVPLAIPGITLRNGPMVNTDALLIFLASVSVLYAVRVAKGDLTVQTSIGLGLSTGLAALTKGHALLLIPVALVAYGVAAVRDRAISRNWLRSAAISGTLSLLAGGWWWIRNLLVSGSIQPLRHPVVEEPGAFDFSTWLESAVDRVVAGFWGGQFALGGRNYMPLFWILSILFAFACVIGWLRSRDRAASSVSLTYLLLLIPAVFLTSALITAERGTLRGIQGRYFYPGLAGLAPLVVLALAAPLRRGKRWLPALFVAGAFTMTYLSLRYMLPRYWNSFGSEFTDRWSGILATAPLPAFMENGTLVLVAASFLVLASASVVIAMRRDSRWTGAGVDL